MARNWYIRDQEPAKPLARKLLICLLAIALIGSGAVGSYIMIGARRADTALSDFNAALAEERFTDAITLYRLAQEKSLSDSWLDQHQDRYRQALTEMELITAERLDGIEARLRQGRRLTADELAFCAEMAEISAVRLVPFLRGLCAGYLRGTYQLSMLENAFDQLAPLANLTHVVGRLPDEFAQMTRAQPLVMAGLASLADLEFWPAWRQFTAIMEDSSLSGFVHEQTRLLQAECKAEMYGPLLAEARSYMKRGRFLSARDALRQMAAVFKDDPAILADLAVCEERVPAVMVRYSGPVEVISVLPLIVNTELAFRDGNQNATIRDTMLTVDEFWRLLTELYANNFILIDHDILLDEQGRRSPLFLPEGKKPIVLVLEGLNYYVSRRQTGTSWDLILEENGEVHAVYPDAEGRMIIDREGEAIGILDLFVEQHPEFSHNGAKGTISLTGFECLFGKVVDKSQLEDRNRALRDMGYAPIDLTADEIAANRRDAKTIIDRLLETGWQFSSFTYGLINARNSSLERIADDTAKWLEQIGSLTGPTIFYNYPFGAFLPGSDERAVYLRNQGFLLFGGQGTTAFLFAGDGYIYVDKTPISGFSLRNSRIFQLERMFDATRVYDRALRGN